MSQSGPKILVIDDDSSLLELTRINLKKLGYDTITAQNADQGIATYSEHLDNNDPFAVVIIDLRLDGVKHGTLVAEELLKLNPEAKLIVSSGDTSHPAMTNCTEYGFKAKLAKDFNRERMKQTIEEVISSSPD